MSVIKASEVKEIETIPFGIREIDFVTGIGGVPLKKITEIFGAWSIGKSTLGYYLVRSAQEMGMDVLWADSEISWSNEYPRSLGVDPERVDLIQARSGEEYLDEIEEWIYGKGEARKGAHTNALVILDSVGHLTPREELEKGSGERQIGGQARLMAAFCRKMKPLIYMNNVALVLLNHEYDPVAFGGTGSNSRFPNSQPSGGKKLEYAKDLSIKLTETWVKDNAGTLLKLVREDGTKGGRYIKAQIWKNKLAATQGREGVFALTFGQGVRKDWRILNDALNANIITKEGIKYFFGGEQIAVGRPKLNLWAKEEENVARLKEALEGV